MAVRAGTAYVDVQADFSRLNKQVAAQIGGMGKTGHRLGSALGKGMFAGAAVAAGGLALVAKEAKAAYGAFEEANKIAKQTNAVLKSTGDAAGVSAKQVDALATSLSRKTGIDDEAIQSGENLLLTFTKVRNEVGKGNDIFTQATRVAVDMSVALGQDLKSSNIQLGKALQDPIKGITALRRVGVNFNQQQSDQIKKMVESGHQLEAQRTILKELTAEFGGSAQAQATAGAKMRVAWGNVQEAIGKGLAPVIDDVAGKLTGLAEDVQPKLEHIANSISATFNRKDIDLGQKLALSARSIRRHLGPVADDIAQGLRAAHLDDKLLAAIQWATPKILAGFAMAGPRAAGALWKGFTQAPLWGQVGGGAWLAMKLGVAGPAAKRLFGWLTGGSLLGKATPMPVFVTNAAALGAAGGAGAAGAAGAAGGAAAGGGGKIKGLLKGAGRAGAALTAVDLAINLVSTKGDLISSAVNTAHDLTFGLVPKIKPLTGVQSSVDLKVPSEITKLITKGGEQDITRHIRFLIDSGDITKLRQVKTALDQVGDNDLTGWGRKIRAEVSSAVSRFDAFRRLGPDMAGTFALMERQTRGHIRDIRTAVTTNIGIIKQRLGTDSAEGRRAMSQNFKAAAAEVKRSMEKGVVSTAEGTAEIRRLMLKSLTSMGLTEEQAKAKLETGTLQPKSARTPGQATEPRQRGGYMPGGRIGDRIPAMLEEGEYVLNRKAVGKIGKGALDRLNYDQYPRFQTGGIVALGRMLQREGYMVGENPAFGGVSAVHVPNSYHYRGMAIDVNADNFPGGEAKALDKLYARLKRMKGIVELLWRVAGHFDHLHVAMSGEGGALPGSMGALKKIVPAVFGGSGFAQALTQQAADVNAGAANTVLQSVYDSMGGVEGSEPGAGVAKGPWRDTLQQIARQRKWNAADWLWIISHESGGKAIYNKTGSGAFGIGQLMPANYAKYGGAPGSSLSEQVQAMAGYIADRYGNPTKAKGYWQAHNSYAKGGIVGMAAGGAPRKVAAKVATAVKKTLGAVKTSKAVKLDASKAGRLQAAMQAAGFDTGPLEQLEGQAALYAELAQRAGDLVDTDGITAALTGELTRRGGKFPDADQQAFVDAIYARGDFGTRAVMQMTQPELLGTELGKLLDWRNLILIDIPHVIEDLKQAWQQWQAAVDLSARLAKEIERLEKAREQAKQQRDDLREEITRLDEALGDNNDGVLGELAAERRKKHPDHKRIGRLEDQAANLRNRMAVLRHGSNVEIGDVEDFGGHHPYAHKHWHSQDTYNDLIPRLLRDKQVDEKTKANLDDVVIPGWEGKRDSYIGLVGDPIRGTTTGTGSLGDNLVDVQGLGSPNDVLGSLPALGVLGGRIFDVQNTLNQLTRNPPRVDASSVEGITTDDPSKELLAQLLREANLRTSVSQAQYEILRTFPAFGGAFAQGGMVPGYRGQPKLILAHGGEVVIPTDAITPAGGDGTNVTVNVAHGMEWLQRFIDIRVEHGTRRQARRGDRTMPGRAGSLHG